MMSTVNRLLVVLMLILATVISGCSTDVPAAQVQDNNTSNPTNQSSPVNDNSEKKASPTEKMPLIVYYATDDAMYLVPETKYVPANDHPAQTAIELLITPASSDNLNIVMPSGTKLRGLSVKNKIAYVDFNNNIVKNNIGGSASEMLLVAAIVNTLTEFPSIEKVQILVEGSKRETIAGHVDISVPLSRSDTIIKK